MASAYEDKGKGGQPKPLGSLFQWGEALSAVKDQIPSLDSDTSVSDGEEDDGELFIFQRDQPNLIPDLSKELEDLPPAQEHLQKTYAFMRHPREAWNEDQENSAFQKDRSALQFGSMGFTLENRDGLGVLVEERLGQEAIFTSESSQEDHKPLRVTSGVLTLEDARKEDFLHPVSDVVPSGEVSPFLNLNTSEEERRVLIETKILSKVSLEPSSGDGSRSQPENGSERTTKAEKGMGDIPAEHPQKLMLSGFKDLEKWNLDKLLQDLKKGTLDTNWTAKTTFSFMDHETTRISSQRSLMGKLEELCQEQSRTLFWEHRRCRTKRPHFDQCQGDGSHVPISASSINGHSLTPEELQCVPEPPTIYIDLRDAAPQRPELLAVEKQSSSDSSTDEEEDAEITGQEKIGEKMKGFSQPSRKDCTGKSFLLQQLRNFRKTMSQSTADGGRDQNLEGSKQTGWLNLKRSQNLKWKDLTSVTAENSESDKRTSALLGLNSVVKPSKEPGKEIEIDPDPKLPQGSFSSHNDLERMDESMK